MVKWERLTPATESTWGLDYRLRPQPCPHEVKYGASHFVFSDIELDALARKSEAVQALVKTLQLARDYVDAEYNDGSVDDSRPGRGDYAALDELSDELSDALTPFEDTDAA